MLRKGSGRRFLSSSIALLGFGALGALTMPACVSDAPTPNVPTCDEYCKVVDANCAQEKQQYRDEAECLKTCSLLEAGRADDTNANTVGCRINQAKAATTLAQCVAAGPFGGGVCGSRCTAFCSIVGKNCLSLENPIYGGSEGTCNEECPSFRFDPNEGEGPLQEFLGNNSLNCRSYHLILSLKSPADAQNHCPHAGVESATCRR